MNKDAENTRILIADDQPHILEALRMLLKGEGYRTETATSPLSLLQSVEKNDYDAILMDLNYTRDTTSGQEGLDLIRRIRVLDNTLPIIVMTAWGSVELAVEAMQRGARDFVQKPWDNMRLLTILRTQLELGQALRKGERLEAENDLLRPGVPPRMIASSLVMKPILDIISRIGPSDANVLITGENGTGKEVIARTIHSISLRATKSLVVVNAGGLSEGIFESELFGHVKGSFTDAKADRVGRFELADGGTLFLDEIANIPLNLQNKLLRVLETGDYERVGSSKTRKANVRILSATNADLNGDVSAGRFRQDLLYRLNTIEIHLPPLRDRQADIQLLALQFLKQHAQRYRKSLDGFDDKAMQLLLNHRWPGNIRELDHTVERAVLMARENIVCAMDLGLNPGQENHGRLEEMSLEEVESFLVKKALARYEGNVSQAADALGLSRGALYRRMQKIGGNPGVTR
jgi:DNA-binding NtrC family response regulator